MLTHEDNELLCRIGPQAPMGQMVRRYWVPAVMSDELEADGAPRRVRLLGENLVAFRDSKGQVGLLDELCPHRGASLVLGRNEECGLRCIYHGLKLDVSGRVVDWPSEPDQRPFKERVRAVSYPVRESGGIVWAYMGPRDSQPAPMDFEFTQLPPSHNVPVKARIACNWVQCLEGVIDSAHTNYLHADTFEPAGGLSNSVYKADSLKVKRPSSDGHPRLEVQDTPYGFRYAALRKPILDADKNAYVRVTLFVAPFYALFPSPAGWGSLQAFVPIDDENTMLYFARYNFERSVDAEERQRHEAWSGFRKGVDLDDEYRMMRNRDNNWLQDREGMKRGTSFSGIQGVQAEDAIVQESMGPLYDRSREHLGTSDLAIVRMRRLMLDSVKRFEKGETPLGLAHRVDYAKLRAEEGMVPLDKSWREEWVSDAA
ncbi:MAG: phthalate 4,5-dioxygenase [Alphaproteobacteria bacterium]|jgi:phthalate 4,5-dioxygenase oxygenase subunit|nr:phthalate 4,5-dioxygenase [Alphaproteobacteria bacterium]